MLFHALTHTSANTGTPPRIPLSSLLRWENGSQTAALEVRPRPPQQRRQCALPHVGPTAAPFLQPRVLVRKEFVQV